ncbi:sporulation related protein [Yoonia maricola]|uniref:Sporulation related protein n=1 Tax=Yoonia maricola TaxID=420999 RepID=A0A2M8WN34_9RHOB|nr:SPOR domain-containing protein [Yoonia maricola]PJI92342.1 sporulation related protein [Yoonia maricola]
MTGFTIFNVKRWPLSVALVSVVGLAACDDNGEFAFPSSSEAQAQIPPPANALNQRPQRDVDVERPDIFSITDNGLWDGRPSLGGVWVAHPEVRDPDRVVIRNTESGQEIVGALFRRERENPGPLLQVSSDAAEALGLLPGAPARLEVVVLRREEVEVEEPANPVVAGLETPVAIEEAPLDPVTEDSDAAGTAAAASAVVLPAALEAATAAAEQTATTATDVATEAADTVDVSSVLAVAAPLPDGSNAQIGVYSVEANANEAAGTITAAGIDARVTPQEAGGRTVWRVTAGPLSDESDVARLNELGFVDAFVIEDAE